MLISGHSDDCIEIEGSKLREEFYVRDNGRSFLRFDGGLVVKVSFGEGDRGWRFTVVANPEGRSIDDSEGEEQDDNSLTVHGPEPKWVRHEATADGPDRKQMTADLERIFDDGPRSFSEAKLRRIYDAVMSEDDA